MFGRGKSPQDLAIEYCLSIGAEPTEYVTGWTALTGRTRRPRWMWYLGARPGQ